MKRLSLLLVAVMVLSAVAASANPFSDVPFSHWAYDAVNKLAAKGIIQGYPDGTFKGKKDVTRYALAMIVAKMLANVEQMLEHGGGGLVTKSDLQTLEKLTVEFADELALLGVKVTALEDDMQVVKEDVSVLKKDVEGIKDYMAKGGMEKVKLSGDMLVRHSSLIHKRDWPATVVGGVAGGGNFNNAQTQTQIRFQFKAMIDENIHAVARWHMLDKTDSALVTANNAAAWGNNGVGNGVRNNNDASANIDLAYLHIKDMFRFGGDFTFGRNFYALGHSLLLSDYVDALKYYKRTGDVDVSLYSIYDRHVGSYEDNSGAVDFRNIWALALGTKYRDHDFYLNFYGQDEPSLITADGRLASFNLIAVGRYVPGLGNVAVNDGTITGDKRWDVEFGAKGPIGKSGHWDYDLGFAYTNYEADSFNTTGTTVDAGFDMQGWLGHAAVKWDSKREWAAKLGYTFGTEESVGALSLDNDRRYDDGIETPYEDISRGNTYFRQGLFNMYALKLQVEYRPRNTKHYFRLAGDWLDELKDTVSNDIARQVNMNHISGSPDLLAGQTSKNNTVYDRWNNFGTSDAKAMVLTFEYRYQLAENTRIRIGYTAFDLSGSFQKAGWVNGAAVAGTPSISAGRGSAGDYDYNMFWAEIYSRF